MMTTGIRRETLIANYIGGKWIENHAAESVAVTNPATLDVLARVGLAGSDEVGRAVAAAAGAFPAWRRTPAQERIQYLFVLKRLLEIHFEEIAPNHDSGKRKDSRRIEGGVAPRHRERGSSLWHPHSDARV